MVLKLDTRIPLVWRNPFDLQFGIEPVRIVLRDVSNAQERMIAALRSGISPSGLQMIARGAGAVEDELPQLLTSLRSLLVPTKTDNPRPVGTVALVGSGPTVQRIAHNLGLSGHRVLITSSVQERECDLGIAVGCYVLDPAVHGFWLRRDLPHLPVVFGDTGATIGPMIEPGLGPCLYCLERYRTEADPVWPAIASQLWGRSSPAETALLSQEVAARVTRLVLARLSGSGAPPRPRYGSRWRAATQSRLPGCRTRSAAAENSLTQFPEEAALLTPLATVIPLRGPGELKPPPGTRDADVEQSALLIHGLEALRVADRQQPL